MDDDPCVLKLSDLVEQHYTLLYRYAFRLCGSATDAEDLTQQTFLTAQRKLGQLRKPAYAKAWLCAIVRNTYLKNLRNRNGTAVVSLEFVAEPIAEDPSGEPALNPQELQTILNELPEEFRTPLILFYFEEFSYKEIAEQMEVVIGTVMSRLARAKSYLRGRLVSRQPATTPR